MIARSEYRGWPPRDLRRGAAQCFRASPVIQTVKSPRFRRLSLYPHQFVTRYFNVALTGPYGHNGAYPTLGGIIRHHLDPTAGFAEWRPGLAALPDVPWLSEKDFLPFADAYERSRLASRLDIRPVPLSEAEVDDLVAFLHALTGTSSIKGRLGRPASVPSGLRVD